VLNRAHGGAEHNSQVGVSRSHDAEQSLRSCAV
jgi:hypothetical protein